MGPIEAKGKKNSSDEQNLRTNYSLSSEGALASRNAVPLKAIKDSKQVPSPQVNDQGNRLNQELIACAVEVDALAAQALTEGFPAGISSSNHESPLFVKLRDLNKQIKKASDNLATAQIQIKGQSSTWAQQTRDTINQNYFRAETSLKTLKTVQQDLQADLYKLLPESRELMEIAVLNYPKLLMQTFSESSFYSQISIRASNTLILILLEMISVAKESATEAQKQMAERARPMIPLITNLNFRCKEIVKRYDEVSQLLEKRNKEELKAFRELFFGNGRVIALDMLYSEFKELLAENPSDLFQSLVATFSFSSLKHLSTSLNIFHTIYPFKSLVHRPISAQCLSRKPIFSPILLIIEEGRKTNSAKWVSFLQKRSSLSCTILSNLSAYTNWTIAESLINKWANERSPMTSVQLSKLYNIVDHRLESETEAYREKGQDVQATLGRKSYLPGEYVKNEIATFTDWLAHSLAICDRDRSIPLIIATAAKTYQWLISIHPFMDGNGRTCRLVMDYVLLRYGLPPPMLLDKSLAVFSDEEGHMEADRAFEVVWEGVTISYQYWTVKSNETKG